MPFPGAHYVILHPSPVIAQDLLGAIVASRPGSEARIHLVADCLALVRLFDSWGDRGPIGVAFLSADCAGLAELLSERQLPIAGRVVMTGAFTEENGADFGGFEAMPEPFSDADLQRVLSPRDVRIA